MINPKHPFYSANDYYREKFGSKIIKIAIDGGFTCPNRDGKLSTKGCIFCSAKGSGDFAGSRVLSVTEQFEQMKEKMAKKWGYGKYLIYFQAFTNTYGSIDKLRQLYFEAANLPDVVGISIATRPDCLSSEVISLLNELQKVTYVTVELGLQTSNENTVKLINRCYENNIYKKAVENLKSLGIDTITHIIIGLPNETFKDYQNTLQFAIDCGTDGIKLQLLHIIKNTELYNLYCKQPFKILSLEEYVDIVIKLIEKTPQNIVIHRITGDGPKEDLFEPRWSLNKRKVLNSYLGVLLLDVLVKVKCNQNLCNYFYIYGIKRGFTILKK